jgi:hypothetical protein
MTPDQPTRDARIGLGANSARMPCAIGCRNSQSPALGDPRHIEAAGGVDVADHTGTGAGAVRRAAESRTDPPVISVDLPSRIDTAEFSSLGSMVAVCCPSDLDPWMRKA